MKQIRGFFIVFLVLAAFCTLRAQDITINETPPLSGSNSAAFREDGIASWYGTEFEGHPTASGELFNPSQMTAAHPSLPFGTMLRVTNIQNRKQVIVRVNDRGPFVNTRIIDVSRAAAEVLDMISTGTAPVIVEMTGENAATIATPEPPPAAPAGPSEFDPWIAPIPDPPSTTTQQPLYPAYPADPSATAQQPVYPAYPAEPPATVQQPVYPSYPAEPPAAAQQPAYPAQPSTTWQPPVTAQQPLFSTPAPVQPPAAVSANPAVVKPGFPPVGTNKRYRVQVGAYTVTRNAVEAFDRVKSVGLEPSYERYNDFYRVVISGVRADDVQNVAGRLGSVGFREVLIREE
ncbi:hypothetical protein AGMMS4952_23730 [Spirochaetia bacterium]|nr:hypothetical protein AGMMS4952_23730 [Spirochaetia bacterium]